MRRESHVRFCEGPRVRLPRATRLILGFALRKDAERVMRVLEQRMAKYGLALHPDKTRLIAFEPPPSGGRGGGATFDFLGFTLHWQRSRTGKWRMAYRTRGARLRRSMKAVSDWCRRHRHLPVEVQHKALVRKLTGHYNYFGVNGNVKRLNLLLQHTRRAWHKWLDRRSQRAHMTWARFLELVQRHPLPTPRVTVDLWARP